MDVLNRHKSGESRKGWAANTLINAVNRYAAENGFDNFALAFESFEATEKGRAMVSAWKEIKNREDN